MSQLQDRESATHFEQFADNLRTVANDLQTLENRLCTLTRRINAPCSDEAQQGESTSDQKGNEGLYWQFHHTFREIAGIRDDIDRHIRRLEQSL